MTASTKALEPLSVEQLWPVQIYGDDSVVLPGDELSGRSANRWTQDMLEHVHTPESPFHGLFTALAGGEGSLQADRQYYKPLVQAVEIGRVLKDTGDEEVAMLADGLLGQIQEKRSKRYATNLRQVNSYISRMDAEGRGLAVNAHLAKVERVAATGPSGTLSRREPYPILSGKDGTRGLKPRHINTRHEIIEINPALAVDL